MSTKGTLSAFWKQVLNGLPRAFPLTDDDETYVEAEYRKGSDPAMVAKAILASRNLLGG